MNNPLFGIVILNWNNYADTRDCVLSLFKSKYTNFFMVIVDNGSTDNSVQSLQTEFSDLHIVRNIVNMGVPCGYNVGFRYALDHGADGIVMLNNDTIVDVNALSEVVKYWDIPKLGVAVPVIYFAEEKDKIWTSGVKRKWFPPRFKMNCPHYYPGSEPISIEYAIGCCIVIKREVFQVIGFLDETIFFMWEDIDFSHRVRTQYKIIQIPKARIWHKVSQTTNPKSELFWRMHGESSTIFFRRAYKFSCIIAVWYHIFFITREFFFKKQHKFLKPFLQGVYSGVWKELHPISYYESDKTYESV